MKTSGDFTDLLDLISHDESPLGADDDYARFVAALPAAVDKRGLVSANRMRPLLSNAHGLTIEPRRYSTLFRRACGDGYLARTEEYDTNDDVRSRNAGRPSRLYRYLSRRP